MMSNLVPCPDCKTMVSPAAASCPKCGRVFKAGDLVPIQSKPLSLGCIIMIVIIVLWIIIAGIKASNEMKEDERIRQRIMDAERRRSGG